MFKRLIQFFKGDTTVTKPCTCGQQVDGICITKIEISRSGVLSQQSIQLVQCGKVRKQMDVVKTIIEGKVVKGGWNEAPITARPKPPPGRKIKEGVQPPKPHAP